MVHYSDILEFWFSDRVKQLQFVKSKSFDKEIIQKFHKTYEHAISGKLKDWENHAEGILALIILLDQFPRNMFRDTPKAFATDQKALSLSKGAIDQGLDLKLSLEYRTFLYMPFMHSEELTEQERSVELFKSFGTDITVKYAIAHLDIIKKWGRFPHRNRILNRPSTSEEIEFLTQPGSSF